MIDTNALHALGALEVDQEGFVSMTCADCGESFAGDKPSDLYDVDDWAGPCVAAVAVVEALAVDSGPLTYNPFAGLA